MKKTISLFVLILLSLSLSACSKSKETVDNSAFGEEESTNNKESESEYNVTDPNFELPSKSAKEIELELIKG